MEKLKMHSLDKLNDNILKIGKLFPNCLTERKNEKGEVELAIDFDVLRQELSKDIVEGNEERYQFTWPDKKQAMRLANVPINKTLRPCREESVDFDTTQNLYIEGDNLEVLKLLQETYLGKIKMIYIDPPYNTGNNLIYKNDFTKSAVDYIKNSGQFDSEGNMIANLSTNGRFHTDWLNMIYPRLKIAKDLLSNDGVIVCAIDENEFATLSVIFKEIWGESNYNHSYVTVVHNPRGQQGRNFSYVNEYLIFVYPNDNVKYLADFPKDEVDSRNLRDSGTESDRVDARNCFYPFLVKNNKIIGVGDVPDNSFHPCGANVMLENGIMEIWPISETGEEKKWRYAKQSVSSILECLEAKEGRSSIQVIYNKAEGTMKSVWVNSKYDASEYGTKLVDKLVANAGFTYPKSLWAVYDAVKAVVRNDKNAIILDFFGGSSTTAHAVMELNKDDNGNRRFINVQIPDGIPKEFTSKTMFKNICEIGKERIRRAGKKIKADNPLTTQDLDIGFRVLKCDSSNMKGVYYTPNEYTSGLFDALADNIKEDRTPEDLLFQVMLDLGVLLSSKIEAIKIGGKQIFNVENGYLMACFDSELTDEVITEIAKKQPYYFVMRDSSMASDSVAANFEQIFNTYSPNTVRRVL